MRSIIILIFVLICANSWLNAVTWHIKQDGSGNFTTIQEGIDASANTDTVLVYPGTYYENIDYNGKSIIVGSLNLTTGDEQYISQTIIDGNQNGSCVRVMSEEDSTTTIYGFSITNGSGNPANTGPYGGGVYIRDSEMNIKNCLIKDNTADCGGGIYIRNSNLFIEGTKLTNNHAISYGGAIFLINNSEIQFDSENLCDIYLNYASKGNDINKASSCPAMIVNVDTFTVASNSLYFINSTSSTGVPLNDVTLNVNNAKIELVYCDLYISALGDNMNSGLTEDNPLQTVNYALVLLSGESNEVYTVHIANGTYSNSLNQQCFPFNMPGNVSIIGESMQGVIWDAEESCMFINDINAKANYYIKNISFINGKDTSLATAIRIDTDIVPEPLITFENLYFTTCIRDNSYLIFTSQLETKFINITSYNNNSGFLRLHKCNSINPKAELENIRIINNQELIVVEPHAFIQLVFDANFSGPMDVIMKNVELTGNERYTNDPDFLTTAVMVIVNGIELYLINSTIGNNIVPQGVEGGAIIISDSDSHINIYNSILYGDNPHEIYIDNFNDPNHFSSVSVSHSLVEGGAVGIQNPYSFNQVYWLEGNLNENPLWSGTGDYPYMLQTSSLCIDAGTLDLPPGIELPEFDLAGNPRIYGETVDMGAYEWQGVGVEDKEVTHLSPLTTQLSNYPNPFNPSTTIKLELAESGKIELAIYNIKGQKVKTLLDCTTVRGTYECVWNGKDEQGKSVSSGQYVVKLELEGKETAKKIMMLK
ncbi:MAG: FlgD immunoglobulin-like domain containing protein [Candidatus Cloacimonadales bacterium]|nr:FlgD immunoglobulin-like domain containing protein [Candidatus Cloacimonadales bacterium]